MGNPYTPELQKLMEAAEKESFSCGETIAMTQDIDAIYYVESGFVKRFQIRNDGSISVHGIYGPRDFFGLPYLFKLLLHGRLAGGGMETYYYEAISESVLLRLFGGVLKKAVDENPIIYKDLFTVAGTQYMSDVWRHENHSLANARKRVAHIILFYMERYGKKTIRGWRFTVPFKQQDLADILDLTRETVSLALSELKSMRLVRGTRKIIVPDLAALRNAAYE